MNTKKKSFLINTIIDMISHDSKIEDRLNSMVLTQREGTRVEDNFVSVATSTNFEANNLRMVVDFGMKGLTKIKQKKKLTQQEFTGLAAIILLEGRPAISITKNKFSKPPSGWKVLDKHRKTIESNILGVGGINLNNRDAPIGTGFLVAEDVIMTNKHVVRKYISKENKQWIFTSDTGPYIDYGQDSDPDNHQEFDINKVLGIHPQFDMALLRLKIENNQRKKPKPLRISKNFNISENRKNIYLIGYPQKDAERNDEEEMNRIFDNIYGVKRLQPGIIRGFSNLDGISIENSCLLHDCSTLGGNSGSCIVDVDTNKVIGLHFDGTYLEINKAISLWNLIDDPFLKDNNINFV